MSGPFREGGPVPPCEACARRARGRQLTLRGWLLVGIAVIGAVTGFCGATFDVVGWTFFRATVVVIGFATMVAAVMVVGLELNGQFTEERP